MTTPMPEAARSARLSRPRWLIPVIAATVAAVLLVLGGIIPFSVMASAAMFGAMMLMHLGGHGGHGGGHAAHAGDRGEEGAPGESSAEESPSRRGGCH